MVLGENRHCSHFGITSPAMGWSPHHCKHRAKAGCAGLAGQSWGMRRCAADDGPGVGSEKETNLALLGTEPLLPRGSAELPWGLQARVKQLKGRVLPAGSCGLSPQPSTDHPPPGCPSAPRLEMPQVAMWRG